MASSSCVVQSCMLGFSFPAYFRLILMCWSCVEWWDKLKMAMDSPKWLFQSLVTQRLEQTVWRTKEFFSVLGSGKSFEVDRNYLKVFETCRNKASVHWCLWFVKGRSILRNCSWQGNSLCSAMSVKNIWNAVRCTREIRDY